MFVWAIVLLVLGIIAFIIGVNFWRAGNKQHEVYVEAKAKDPYTREDDGGGYALGGLAGGIVAVILILTGVGLWIGSSVFAQDPGQATVVRNWGGALEGEPATTEGWHNKAPWSDTFTFDIRNQRIVFVGGAGSDSVGDNSGGENNGPQITVQDRDGVTSNIDITVTYSISPSAVADIYRTYHDADGLRANRLFNDIRSIVRSVPGQYSTLELLTERDKLQNDIRAKLEKKWSDLGIVINDVALQEIRVPDSVKESYAAAQQAQIDVEKAKAQLESATVSAQQKVVQAQAEADANAILNASLSSAILQQRYLDTLAKLAEAGNLVVVPEGFNGLVNVSK